MTLVCGACARVNPAEALYCYFDGRALPGARGNGPVASGSQPFLTPFVFPAGRSCRSFDELLLACYQNWSEAQELLHEGYFEGFMGGVGRADLARAARQASASPDSDRGLDDFLGRLPATVREPARLVISPAELNLGQIDRNGDRRLELHLENQGMALLHGSITCEDSPWLMLGDGSASTPHRLFQFLHDLTLPIHILGQRTRAGNKPLEGKIVIESNGGRAVLTVRAEVPVVEFTTGVLAGARSPRQVAEKARARPREAAPLFENGAVAEWYKANGWIYPIQGEPATGLGAVQQFFEALGLTTPPRVEISTQSVSLAGVVDAELEHSLQLRTVENRPVFAHAVSMTPWLKIGRVTMEGRTARIRLIVPAVPDQPGERLMGKVQVTANGNQRFTVAVLLQVTGPAVPGGRGRSSSRVTAPMMELPPAPPVPAPVKLEPVDDIPMLLPWTAEPPRVLPAAAPPPPVMVTAAAPPPPARRTGTGSGPALPAPPTADLPVVGATPSPLHLIPAALLAIFLFGFVVHDVLLKPEARGGGDDPGLIDTDPYIALRLNDGESNEDSNQLFKGMPASTMRFGLVMLRERGESPPQQKQQLTRKLNYDKWGRTNNCIVRIDPGSDDGDDGDNYFGHVAPAQQGCRWVEKRLALGKGDGDRIRDGYRSIWLHEESKVQVTQTVEIVAGEVSATLDTCLVTYLIENKDSRDHNVGLRFLLDTYIGGNDGAPFLIPGQKALCSTSQLFDGVSAVPDFIEAMEKADLQSPGTVARIQFKLGGRYESPARVFLGGWPDGNLARFFNVRGARGQFTKWKVPELGIFELREKVRKMPEPFDPLPDPDSAVTMYWPVKKLGKGEKRELAFTYGLGQNVTGQSGGRLALSFGGRLVRGGEFTVTALVSNPGDGEKLTLTLPSGLRLAEGDEEQAVPAVARDAARRISPVTWRVKADEEGQFELQVRSSSGAREAKKVTIRSKGVFD